MKNTRLNLLFQRYLDGTCSHEEKSELIERIATSDDPDAQHLLERLWNEQRYSLPQEKKENILHAILRQSGETVPISRNYLWAKVAAAISVLLLAGIALYELIPADRSLSYATEKTIEPEPHKYVSLPDGSKVILNNSSNLRYADSFDGKEVREVYLTGEAFFDISHDEAKPFIVHTGKISTTVLGTAFNIKAYPEQNDITITVTRGKVQVSDESQVLGILAHDEQITFQKTTDVFRQNAVQSKEAVAWMDKDIFFDDVSMADAMAELENRFYVGIRITNPKLNDCRFTATFVRGEDLNQILDVICEFNEAEYTVDNKSGAIEITGNGCSN
jgi:transmembrane sensor